MKKLVAGVAGLAVILVNGAVLYAANSESTDAAISTLQTSMQQRSNLE